MIRFGRSASFSLTIHTKINISAAMPEMMVVYLSMLYWDALAVKPAFEALDS